MLVRKVLSTRRATGFGKALVWRGRGGGGCGLAKVWGHALLENIEILHLQRFVFLHSEVSDNLFQLPKKDNFYRQFNHDLDTCSKIKIDGLLIKGFSDYNHLMNILVGQSHSF